MNKLCGNLDFPHKPNIIISQAVFNHSGQWGDTEISQDEAMKLERNTRDQKSEKWHNERQKRLTASNFGRFMLWKAAITQKFVDSLIKPKPFSTPATSYGLASEKVAKNMYRKKMNNHVHECGLVVNPLFPFLGASPDGKICDGETGILEVKCPFSIRDWKISDALKTYDKRNTLCVELCGDEIKLKCTHAYWHQVQGQLLVTGASYCDFVVYMRQDISVQRIRPDKVVMEEILNKLYSVYVDYMVKG